MAVLCRKSAHIVQVFVPSCRVSPALDTRQSAENQSFVRRRWEPWSRGGNHHLDAARGREPGALVGSLPSSDSAFIGGPTSYTQIAELGCCFFADTDGRAFSTRPNFTFRERIGRTQQTVQNSPYIEEAKRPRFFMTTSKSVGVSGTAKRGRSLASHRLDAADIYPSAARLDYLNRTGFNRLKLRH